MKKFLLPILFLLSITGYSQSSELTVIGNNKGVPAQLSTENLKSIFMGNQPKWSDGTKVVIAMMKFTTDGGKTTCSKLYQKSTMRCAGMMATILYTTFVLACITQKFQENF